MRRSWFPYLVLLPVLVIALFFGSRGDDGPPTTKQRVTRIAKEVRCPTCEGLSADESDTPASQAIREEIARRVESGQSDAEIRSFLVSRYGKDILLKPESTGVASLVWILPVAGGLLAAAGLIMVFRRWRTGTPRSGSPEDQALVDQARRR